MRGILFVIILSFLITGYSAAAHAFGEIMACPNGMIMAMDMKDCCNHTGGKTTGHTCLKCAYCCAVTATTLETRLSLQEPRPAAPEMAVMRSLDLNLSYPNLRPPDLQA